MSHDSALFREIIDLFLDHTPKDLITLQQALNNKDWILFGEYCHRLKTSFATLGFQKEHNLLQDMEHSVKANRIESYKWGTVINGIQSKFNKSYAFLSKVSI